MFCTVDEVLCLHSSNHPDISPVPSVASEVTKEISNESMVVMKGTKCESRYPSVAKLDSDGMIVMSENIKLK